MATSIMAQKGAGLVMEVGVAPVKCLVVTALAATVNCLAIME